MKKVLHGASSTRLYPEGERILCYKCGKWGIIKWKKHAYNRYYLYVFHKYDPIEYAKQKERGLKRPNGNVYHKYKIPGVDGRRKHLDNDLINWNIDWNKKNEWNDKINTHIQLEKEWRRFHKDN